MNHDSDSEMNDRKNLSSSFMTKMIDDYVDKLFELPRYHQKVMLEDYEMMVYEDTIQHLIIDDIKDVELSFHISSDLWYIRLMCKLPMHGTYVDYLLLYYSNIRDRHIFPEFINQDDTELLTKEMLKLFIQHIMTLLDKLVFDKIINRFVDSKEQEVMYIKNVIFNKYLPVINQDTCCVCHENTTIKTLCNHVLCIKCYKMLKKDVCPMCRNDDIMLKFSR